MSNFDFNTPPKRLEYLNKAEEIWKYIWYAGVVGLAVFIGIKVVPYITIALENFFIMALWALAVTAFVYVATHKGLRKLLLRAFDHLIYYLDRLLRTHNPFIDARISIDRLKDRLKEIQEGQINVKGAADKLFKKIKSFEASQKEALTAAKVASEKMEGAPDQRKHLFKKQIQRFSRKAANYLAAAQKLTPQYETANRIAIRLGEFYDMMEVSIDEQEDTLKLELEMFNLLAETKEATDAAYAMLSGTEKAEFDEAMEIIQLNNAKLGASADIFIQNTTTLVEMFQFEDEVKTEMAVQEFEKWMVEQQRSKEFEFVARSKTKELNPANARSLTFDSETKEDPYGLLDFTKKQEKNKNDKY